MFLAGFGVENADSTVNAVITVAVALFAAYRRWNAGDLHWTGFRK